MYQIRVYQLANCFGLPPKNLADFAVKLQQNKPPLPYGQGVKGHSSNLEESDIVHILTEYLKQNPIDREVIGEIEKRIDTDLKDPIKQTVLSVLKEHLRKIEITEDVLLVKINNQYKDGMTDQELYELTRKLRPLGKRREKAEYAFYVYKGEVKEVYEIQSWHTCEGDKPGSVFTGVTAEDSIRDKYVGQDISHYFQKFNTNQFNYVNC